MKSIQGILMYHQLIHITSNHGAGLSALHHRDNSVTKIDSGNDDNFYWILHLTRPSYGNIIIPVL